MEAGKGRGGRGADLGGPVSTRVGELDGAVPARGKATSVNSIMRYLKGYCKD